MNRTIAAWSMVASSAMAMVSIGCGDRPETGAPSAPASTALDSDWQSVITGLPIEIRDRGHGLIVSVYHSGDAGAPAASVGDTVEIEFVARWIGADGAAAEFDSSAERGAPLRVPLAKGSAVVGLLRGLEGLRAGDVARIRIPSALGYRAAGRGSIPGNADLEFDVRVRGVEQEPATP